MEQAERGELVQTTTDIGNEIPFGVKALELEPAIEGVWNARMATPLHTPLGSRTSSPRIGASKRWQSSNRGSSVSSISRLDIEEPAQATFPSGQSCMRENPVELRLTDLIVPVSAPAAQIDERPSVPASRRKKANSITISYSGLSIPPKDDPSCCHCMTDSSGLPFSEDGSYVQTKLLLNTPPRRTGSLRRRFIIGGRSSGETIQDPLIEENRSAIDRMDAHRKLHSAECGQLIRRNRRHTSEMPDHTADSSSTEEDVALRTRSWPIRENSIRLGQRIPRKAEKQALPQAVPQHASIENKRLARPCPSAWTSRTHEIMKEKLAGDSEASGGAGTTLPSLDSNTTLSTITATSEPLSIPNTHTRKVNEDFEILPAGAFAPELSLKKLSRKPFTIAHPPNTQRKSRKLQKRVRSDSASSISSCDSSGADGRLSEDLGLRRTVY